MRRWVVLQIYFVLHLSCNLTVPFTVHHFGKIHQKCSEKICVGGQRACVEAREKKVRSILKKRREGLSQVFRAVQLMLLSLPAVQREKEGMGEMSPWGERGQKRCTRENNFLRELVLPLCFKTRLFFHLCYESLSFLRKLVTVRWLQLPPIKTEHEQNNCILLKFN